MSLKTKDRKNLYVTFPQAFRPANPLHGFLLVFLGVSASQR